MIRWAAALVLVAPMAVAQEIVVETLDGPAPSGEVDAVGTVEGSRIVETLNISPLRFESLQQDLGDVTSETVVAATVAEGATLRGLDKLTGALVDFELPNGYSANFGTLRVDMAQCRHPEDNATGEAYAYLTVLEGNGDGAAVFEGWMIASSPALSALDHARYDVWVLRCKTSEAEGNE